MHGLRIGQVAKQTGVNVETLRYYEREGLVAAPPRTVSGYRAFPAETVARIRFIRRAKAMGIRSVPAVVIDGKLADCCAGRGPDKATLRSAGLGQPI